MSDTPIRVLFVCLGNICRSPTAEGVFRQLLIDRNLDGLIHTDSAGTGAYHIGEPPDRRSQQAARQRGIDISDLRARQVTEQDFNNFHWILAADHDNYHDLKRIETSLPDRKARLAMFMEYSDTNVDAVPDPYFGGAQGFEHVLDLCQQASEALLEEILNTHPHLRSRP